MMDSADEAGGEAVFSSDGLPSLTAPLPPPPLPSIGASSRGGAAGVAAGDNNGGDAVIEEDSDPRVAFEAFSDAGITGWMGHSSTNNNASSKISTWEDPRRRLFQLKSELDQLEATLATEKESKAGGEGDNDDNDDLHAMTLELKSRLNAMGMADSSSLATMLRGRQEDLSRVIARDLEKFGNQEGSTIAKEMEGLSLKGESEEGYSDVGDGKIVYELYRDNASSSTKTIPREILLEERLRKLELAMGSSTTTNEGTKSILERISEAERLTKEVDAKQIEKLASKAKVVRADLEAAARAKTKLASKSNTTGTKEDAFAITALHSQLVELEGLSGHLPALTVRLVELSNLHTNAAEFASRLDAAEAAVGRSEGVLTSVERALKDMEGGWKVNMEGVERNVRRLDELLVKAGQAS